MTDNIEVRGKTKGNFLGRRLQTKEGQFIAIDSEKTEDKWATDDSRLLYKKEAQEEARSSIQQSGDIEHDASLTYLLEQLLWLLLQLLSDDTSFCDQGKNQNAPLGIGDHVHRGMTEVRCENGTCARPLG